MGRLHNKVATYKKKGKRSRRVWVYEHVYSVDGRLSNWCHFKYIDPKTGQPTEEEGADYDYGSDNFVSVSNPILIVLDPKTARGEYEARGTKRPTR